MTTTERLVDDQLFEWARANPSDLFDLLFQSSADLTKANARIVELLAERNAWREDARQLGVSCERLRDRVQQLERRLCQTTTNPHGRGGDPVLESFVAGLRERPGLWAAWPRALRLSSARSYLFAIPAGRLRLFGAGEFQAKVVGDLLYVRFVGSAHTRYVGGVK